jgi:excisionase family DNA binding protein
MDGIQKTHISVADDGFMSIPEIREFYSLGDTKVRDLIRQGVLPKCKFGRVIRVPRRAVVAYAEAQLNQAAST